MNTAHRCCDEMFLKHMAQSHGGVVFKYNEDDITLEVGSKFDDEPEFNTIYPCTTIQTNNVLNDVSLGPLSLEDAVERRLLKAEDILETAGARKGTVDSYADGPVIVELETGYQHKNLTSFLTQRGALFCQGGSLDLLVNQRYGWWQLEHLNRVFLVYHEKWIPLPYSHRHNYSLHDAAHTFYMEEKENIEAIADLDGPWTQIHVEVVAVMEKEERMRSCASYYGDYRDIYKAMRDEAIRAGKLE